MIPGRLHPLGAASPTVAAVPSTPGVVQLYWDNVARPMLWYIGVN